MTDILRPLDKDRCEALINGAPPVDATEAAFLTREHHLIAERQAERVKEIEAMLKEAKTDLLDYQLQASAATKRLLEFTGGTTDFYSPFYGRLATKASHPTVKNDAVFEAWCRRTGRVKEAFPTQKDLTADGFKWSANGNMRRPAADGRTVEYVPGLFKDTVPVIVFEPTAPDELTAVIERADEMRREAADVAVPSSAALA